MAIRYKEISYFKFDGNFVDETGGIYPVNHNGVSFNSGQFGQSAEFIGSSLQYLDMGRPINSGSITITFWVYISSTGDQRIMSQEGNNEGDFIISIANTDKLRFARWNGVGDTIEYWTTSTISLSTGFNFCAINFDGTNVKFFIGSSNEMPSKLSTTISPTQRNLFLGRYSSQYFTGRIDEFRIYYSSLSDSDISSIMEGNRIELYTEPDTNINSTFSTVIKISNDYENFLAQFIDVNDLYFEEELASTGSLSFSIPISATQTEFLQRFRKISLYILDGVNDELVWTGYIEDIEDDFEKFTISCKDEKHFLKNKIIYETKRFNVDMGDALSTLTSEANARAGNSFFSYENSITTTIDKTFEKGSDYYTIIQSLAELLNAEWNVLFGKIYFKSTIGIDRSTGSDFVEFVSNIDSPNEDNIKFKGIRRGSEIGTAILGKAGATYSDKSDLLTIFGRIERFVSFEEGSADDQTQEYLDLHKTPQREIEIFITDNTIDFRKVNVGDIVSVRINRNNPLIDVNDTLKVIQKRVSFTNLTPKLEIKVSKLNKIIATPANLIAEIFNRVKKLEL